MSFTLELHVYFICPLHVTGKFPKYKLKFCLWYKINTIWFILKITQKPEPNALRNLSISWNDIKAFVIYRNKQDAWHQILLKTEISSYIWHQTDQLSSYLCDVFTWYCRIHSWISENKMKFGNFCVNGSLNVFVTLHMMTSVSNQIWHFQGPWSRDLTTGYASIWVGARFCKVEVSH